MDEWKRNLLEDDAEIAALLADVETVAVLGIKPESHAGQPAHYVAAAIARDGADVIPVPVYYPEVTSILGRPVYRTLAAVPQPIDLVDVFRRPNDIPGHLDDLLACRPKGVWFQSGIRNEEVAEELAKAGIRVVQDRCLMVEWERLRS